MTLKELLAQRRFKKSLITKFARTHKFITTILQKRGFRMSDDPVDPRDGCYVGRKGIFLSSEKVGPGIVGTLLCCSQCNGFKDIHEYLIRNKKLPDTITIKCAIEHKACDGLYKPVILYPMLKKPNNKPFVFEIPYLKGVIENFVLPKKGK